MQKQLEFIVTIEETESGYIGYVIISEKYDPLRLVIDGKIQGKISVGRQKNIY